MMGLEGRKPERDPVDGTIQTLTAHNVRVMSIGFLMDSTQALIWLGPMVHKAVYQL
jgi:ATP-binding protein involved in chromosome partitioning